MAILYANLSKYDEDVKFYLEAVKLHPDSPLGHYGLGYCYFFLGQMDKAIESLRKVLALHPSYMEAQMLLDRAIAAKGTK
jgi:tetratricopeptide (TPR) repeat protein